MRRARDGIGEFALACNTTRMFRICSFKRIGIRGLDGRCMCVITIVNATGRRLAVFTTYGMEKVVVGAFIGASDLAVKEIVCKGKVAVTAPADEPAFGMFTLECAIINATSHGNGGG